MSEDARVAALRKALAKATGLSDASTTEILDKAGGVVGLAFDRQIDAKTWRYWRVTVGADESRPELYAVLWSEYYGPPANTLDGRTYGPLEYVAAHGETFLSGAPLQALPRPKVW